MKKRVFELEGLKSFVLDISEKISVYKLPLNELLLGLFPKYSEYQVINQLSIQYIADKDILSSWRYINLSQIDSEEISIMDNFFDNLGKGVVKSQTNLCNQTLLKLSEAEENAKKDVKEKSKLYNSMGFLFGVLVVILFI